MAVITISLNGRSVVADFFDSYHEAQAACGRLKSEGYPEESILQFVQLTAQDNLEARAAILKDLGFYVKDIRIVNEELAKGRVLVCVDFLEERSVEKVGRILGISGGLKWEREGRAGETREKSKRTTRKKAPKKKSPTVQ